LSAVKNKKEAVKEMSMSMSLKMNLSEVVLREVKRSVQEVVKEAVKMCGSKYNFDASEAVRELGLEEVELLSLSLSLSCDRGIVVKKDAKKVSVGIGIPLPFSGVIQEECCIALRQNSGLYTQCQSLKSGSSRYCNQCEKKGSQEYGTVESRMAVGLQDYVDSKGRKQVHYTKIMKKLNLTEEQVMEVANKHGIKVDGSHFIAPVDASKRGRPKSEKPAKVSSGVKGRPKKEKKVVEIAGDEDDLFANLVAQANRESVEEAVEVQAVVESAVEVQAVVESAVEMPAVVESAVEVVDVPIVEKPAAKVSKSAAEKAAEKAEKDAQKAAEKAEKEAQKAAEKAEKEAQKAAEKAAKEAEKAEKEAQKAAEKAAKDTQKVEKVAQKVAEKAAKEDDQAEVVKKIEFAGHKYLKSKKTGIVYDYAEYVKTGDQIVVGQWNDETSAIDFKKACDDEEESEDEYEA
jgi:regulator of protease activity HflC (stomatin/prohibitin superfamily)